MLPQSSDLLLLWFAFFCGTQTLVLVFVLIVPLAELLRTVNAKLDRIEKREASASQLRRVA